MNVAIKPIVLIALIAFLSSFILDGLVVALKVFALAVVVPLFILYLFNRFT